MDELYKTLLSSLYDENCLEKQYSKIYKIHKYWARKPWFIVEKYIKEHSKINDVVMDPFCGSGVTGAEAIVNGRNFIGQDLNPMSILVTQGTLLNNINFEDLKEDFKKIQDACQNKIQSLYYVDSFCPSFPLIGLRGGQTYGTTSAGRAQGLLCPARLSPKTDRLSQRRRQAVLFCLYWRGKEGAA